MCFDFFPKTLNSDLHLVHDYLYFLCTIWNCVYSTVPFSDRLYFLLHLELCMFHCSLFRIVCTVLYRLELYVVHCPLFKVVCILSNHLKLCILGVILSVLDLYWLDFTVCCTLSNLFASGIQVFWPQERKEKKKALTELLYYNRSINQLLTLAEFQHTEIDLLCRCPCGTRRNTMPGGDGCCGRLAEELKSGSWKWRSRVSVGAVLPPSASSFYPPPPAPHPFIYTLNTHTSSFSLNFSAYSHTRQSDLHWKILYVSLWYIFSHSGILRAGPSELPEPCDSHTSSNWAQW